MNRPLISVIIPVYKVEAYLEFCIDSVLNQTFQDFELILVDDGSPDSCPEICDRYAAAHARVQVIHQKNRGLSAARNTGIGHASGDYLCFIDSDDYVYPCYLEHLYRAVKETGADMAVCQIQSVDLSIIYGSCAYPSPELLQPYDAFACLFSRRNTEMVIATNKLYARQLFSHIRYPEGLIHEDEAVIHLIIDECQLIAWLNEPLYCYRQREGSITKTKYSLKRLDELTAKENRLLFFQEKGFDSFFGKLAVSYCSMLMRHYRTVLYEIDDPRQRNAVLKELFDKFCRMHPGEMGVPLRAKTKIRYGLFRLCPRLIAAIEYRKYERKTI